MVGSGGVAFQEVAREKGGVAVGQETIASTTRQPNLHEVAG
jgi:hypothetical protein